MPASVTPTDLFRLAQEMLDDQRRGLEDKWPDVASIRQTAWEEGLRAGQVQALQFYQKWLTARLASQQKYEDTRALEELRSLTQYELGRVQDGSATVVNVGGEPTAATGTDAT